MSDSKELTLPERAAVALGTPEHEKNLIALSTKYADLREIKNPAGREQCHAAYMELKNTRVAIKKAGEEAREDATKFGKAVITEVERLTAITAAEETRLQTLRDLYDEQREAERQAKLVADKARVDGIRNRIMGIQMLPGSLIGKSSTSIAQALADLESCEITIAGFMEFTDEAEMVKVTALDKLKELLQAQQFHEAEEARIEDQRQQLAKARAETEERDRIAAEARAEQEVKDRAERERVETEQRAANERAAAAMREQQEAHERRMAEQQAELDRKQAEVNAALAEQERIAREAQEAKDAEAARIAQAEADRIFAQEEQRRQEEVAEAQRVESERRAAEEERLRREQVEFEKNGPGDSEMIAVLAEHYDVSSGVVVDWLTKFDAASFLNPTEEKAA